MPPSIRRRATVTLCVMLLAGAAEFALMVALRELLIAVTGADGIDGVRAITLFALSSAFVAITRLITFAALDRLAVDYSAFASTAIFRRAMHRSYRDYQTAKSAELFAALENSQRFLNSALTPLLQAIVSAIIATVLTIYLLRLAPGIVFPMLFLALLIYTFAAFLTRGRLRRGSAALQRLATERLQVAHAAQQGFRDLILAQTVGNAIARFTAAEEKYRSQQIRVRLAAIIPRHIVELLVASLLVALALYGAGLPEGILPHIPLFAVIALGVQRLLPLWSGFYTGWSNFQGNSAFLAQTLAAMPDPRQAEPGTEAVFFADCIEFVDVGLCYADRAPVLNRMQLRIPRGSRIGIVGGSGSGKSSLLDLLMGLIEPSEGRILVDGLPLDTPERRRGWQQRIASVSQSSFLPDTILAAAIAGNEDTPDPGRLAKSVHGASLEPFVASLAQGLATRTGEAGILMSGGERQRIAIARALYRGASLLVLDEPTANLDEATECAVVTALSGVERDITMIIATHRMAPLAVCDQVYVLENGQLRPMDIGT